MTKLEDLVEEKVTIKIKDKTLELIPEPADIAVYLSVLGKMRKDVKEADINRLISLFATMVKRANPDADAQAINKIVTRYFGHIFRAVAEEFGFVTGEELAAGGGGYPE